MKLNAGSSLPKRKTAKVHLLSLAACKIMREDK